MKQIDMKEIIIEHGNNKLILTKEDNIKLSIVGNDKSVYRFGLYELENRVGVSTMKNLYQSDVLKNGWSSSERISKEDYPNKIIIFLRGENNFIEQIIYDNIKEEFFLINKLLDTTILDKVSSPLLISGCYGGGTSFVAKMLRFRGIYMGSDSGNIKLRKPHESATFINLGETTKFKDGKFLDEIQECDVKEIEANIKENTDFFIQLFKDKMKYMFSHFWGNGSINSMWGWKAPINSLLLPIWRGVFPNCRILVVTRNQEKLSTNIHDIEGSWFRTKATDYIKTRYMNPDVSMMNENEVFYCDFKKVTTDMNELNKVFEWVGVELLKSEEEFKSFLKQVG